MTVVKPFSAWRYDLEKVGNPADVIVPPYDVITEKERDQMMAANEFNFANIILAQGDEKHQKAARLLKKWQDSGVLIHDPIEAVYFYQQDFQLNSFELFCQKVPSKLSRYGFFATVKVEEYKEKIILPHEKTFAKYKADRYELTDETKGNMEPIFLGYDSDFFSGKQFESAVKDAELLYDYEDNFGVKHKLWSVTNEKTISDLRAKLSQEKLYILDGHHRYETALKYYQDHPSDKTQYVLANICAFKQEGTVILPTHRLVQGGPKFNGEKFLSNLKNRFNFTPVDSLKELESRLMDSENVAFGLRMGKDQQLTFLELKEKSSELDLDYLHENIIPDSVDAKISYVRSIPEFEDLMSQGEHHFGFLVRPNTYDDVVKKALHQEVMPHKSTFFYPKIPSGLVIHGFS